MNEFLDTLRSRVTESQSRLNSAKKRLEAAQAEYELALQESTSWQNAVQAETTRTQPLASNFPIPSSPNEPSGIIRASRTDVTAEHNKTEMVRILISQHPTGMTPTELWKELSGKFAHRAYLYSILKRLKDKEEVMERRGRYVSKVSSKPVEGEEQQNLLQ